MIDKDVSKAKKTTQLIFLVCGLGISSWAPMAPFAKDRLNLNDADFGLLLLLLGLGAITMMPLSGIIMHKIGSRKIIAAGSVVAALTLPLLLIIPSYAGMAITLFIFGCGIGTIDVAMNAHGVHVQNLYDKPIMSSLHGLFSVGGLCGSLLLGVLIKMGLNPLHAAVSISLVMLFMVLSQYRNLFSNKFEKDVIENFTNATSGIKETKRFQWLNGSVLWLGFMCFSAFLSEGAMLDWSAVFLHDLRNVTPEFAGVGYAAFSIAMAVMRLSGDKIIEKLNSKTIVVAGSLIAVLGLTLIVLASWLPAILCGFIFIGIGASNIVPIFFIEGGRIKGVTPTVSIPVITTMGYAGQLAGPALLGFVANKSSLEVAFGAVAFLMLIIAAIYFFRTSK